MKLVILRTDIQTDEKVVAVAALFNNNPEIRDWSVDTEDIDNVLRIEANNRLLENDVIELLRTNGYYGEPLPD